MLLQAFKPFLLRRIMNPDEVSKIRGAGTPRQKDCSTEVLLDVCTRATFLRSVHGKVRFLISHTKPIKRLSILPRPFFSVFIALRPFLTAVLLCILHVVFGLVCQLAEIHPIVLIIINQKFTNDDRGRTLRVCRLLQRIKLAKRILRF
jgi:hypothetical protein